MEKLRYDPELAKAKRLEDRRAELKPGEDEKRRRDRTILKKLSEGKSSPALEELVALYRDAVMLGVDMKAEGLEMTNPAMRFVKAECKAIRRLIREEKRRLGIPCGGVADRVLLVELRKELATIEAEIDAETPAKAKAASA
jgi:hypothetical protein